MSIITMPESPAKVDRSLDRNQLQDQSLDSTTTWTSEAERTQWIRSQRVSLWRYLRFLGADSALAEDLAQETFVAVLEKPFEFRGENAAAAYMRTVARNLFLKQRRRQQRDGMNLEAEAIDVELAEQVWSERMPTETDQYLSALDDCLQHLSARAQETIQQFYRHGKSRKAIADQQDVTEEGVKTTLRRARAALKECVQRKLK